MGARAVAFEELLATADVISLHVRLNDTTRGMIGSDQFRRMKQGAIIINTARGGVIDEGALISALNTGRIAGAVAWTSSRRSRCPQVIRFSRWTMW
ncbi:MAG: hypothetical protein M5U07_02560 [Xanthobacteraceae bacterium]|nr:hypothetical protein [Xanthobacteraceae bacterium]